MIYSNTKKHPRASVVYLSTRVVAVHKQSSPAASGYIKGSTNSTLFFEVIERYLQHSKKVSEVNNPFTCMYIVRSIFCESHRSGGQKPFKKIIDHKPVKVVFDFWIRKNRAMINI